MNTIEDRMKEKADVLLGEALISQAEHDSVHYAHYVNPEQINVLLIAGATNCFNGINHEQEKGKSYTHDVSYKGMRFTSATIKPVLFMTKEDLQRIQAQLN